MHLLTLLPKIRHSTKGFRFHFLNLGIVVFLNLFFRCLHVNGYPSCLGYRTLTATTTGQIFKVTDLPGNLNSQFNKDADCTINIQPSPLSKNSRYLKITWNWFSVNGDMPLCSQEYVQIHITRKSTMDILRTRKMLKYALSSIPKGGKNGNFHLISFRGAYFDWMTFEEYKAENRLNNVSLGRFCSKNGAFPFTIYSHDRYAVIKFHYGGIGTGYGFTFTYQLSSSPLIRFGCQSTTYDRRHLKTDVLSSVNWPLNYPIHEDWCEHQIRPSSGKQTKIVFMDVNVATDGRSGCGYDDDFLEVKGSYSSSVGYDNMRTLKSKFCSGIGVSVTTDYPYVTVYAERHIGSSTRRGFVAGFMTYDKPSTKPKGTGSSSGRSSLSGYIIAPIAFGAALFVLWCACHQRQRRRRNINSSIAGTRTSGQPSSLRVSASSAPDLASRSTPPENLGTTPAYFASTELMNRPPPSYQEAMSTPSAAPPSYAESTENLAS